MGDVIRFREPEIVAVVGGLVDESRVTLGIYGDDLDPEEISGTLGCVPTSAHRRGDARKDGVPPWTAGAWLLMIEGKAPQSPEQLLDLLLSRVPTDPQIWKRLRARFSVRMMFGIFISQWNRGFELTGAAISRLQAIGAEVGFDIYSDLEGGDG